MTDSHDPPDAPDAMPGGWREIYHGGSPEAEEAHFRDLADVVVAVQRTNKRKSGSRVSRCTFHAKIVGTPVLRGVKADGGIESGSLIDEIVREGARRMLAAALEAEVNQYIAEFAAETDEHGRRLVVRNGHHRPRTVVTAAGPVEVTAPRVNDRRRRSHR